jgi:hypothetical protein
MEAVGIGSPLPDPMNITLASPSRFSMDDPSRASLKEKSDIALAEQNLAAFSCEYEDSVGALFDVRAVRLSVCCLWCSLYVSVFGRL